MNELTEIIISAIKNKGQITFAEFMELALYQPRLGYYSSGKANIGKEGDFYTSPHVHESFGKVLANFIIQSLELIGGRNPAIVELGAGKGFLANDILSHIKEVNPNIYNQITYYLIEHSAYKNKDLQKQLIEHEDKVQIRSGLDETSNLKLNGVVISNEFFDALPFHRLKIVNGEASEIYVAVNKEQFSEITGKPSNTKIVEYYSNFEKELKESQEFEINLLAKDVLKSINTLLSKGIILTVDYGFLSDELFSPARMKGTYKCIHKHKINETPYLNIGEQDITAHVDFSNLINTGKSLGINPVKYTSQGQFLIDWGIVEILEKSSGKDIQSIKNLFLPELMGDRFKVLVQEKNLGDKIGGFYPEPPFKISFNVL